RRVLVVSVGSAGHLPSSDAREARLVEDADPRLGAAGAAIREGLAGVQADRGDRGEDADLRLTCLEPEPFGLDVEPVATVDRRDLDPGVTQSVGDRVGGGPDELDRAGDLALGPDLLGDPVDGRVDADQPGLLADAEQ